MPDLRQVVDGRAFSNFFEFQLLTLLQQVVHSAGYLGDDGYTISADDRDVQQGAIPPPIKLISGSNFGIQEQVSGSARSEPPSYRDGETGHRWQHCRRER